MPTGNLAPPGQVSWSGQNWYEVPSSAYRATTSVIERTQGDEKQARGKRGRRVPFGFSVAPEPEPEPDDEAWEGMGL